MLRRIQQYIKHHDLLSPTDKVLVALSGGADSVALLDILLRAGYTCVAVHCNFHLRGEESDRDEVFVQHLCQQLDTPLLIKHFDTQHYAKEHGISIEMAARDLRYEWFAHCLQTEQCRAVAVAHHRNDQAETLLLNLKRGTGLRGLCGMHPRNGHIVRPLLCVTHEDILNYLSIRHLEHVEDSTNTDTAYRRNAIRAWLQTCSKAETEHIADTCTHMQGYKQIVQAYIDTLRPTLLSSTGNEMRIDIERLLAAPSPEIVLYELLLPYGFTQTDDIFRSLKGNAGKQFFSPRYTAIKDRTHIIITPTTECEDKTPELTYIIRLIKATETYPKAAALQMVADSRIADEPLTIRRWKAGDWFIPIGMKGKRKVSDFLKDLKVPLTEKQQVWVVCSGENIAWVVGYRIDNRFKVTNATQQVAEIKITFPA
ncbi:MAG: tRNA lysidine(34) synthetase TilS [Paludibacter sp.]|nr:tRNA lysidine(34) synthetase TilS [Bacteroidales bacterium]MCM1069484.1 tRNA lysidine(34) synthetase TilS [Prevotella sp.]MCM1354140.1 tRNA lysidine(34) synthetase TilS [Bacteroides sp.]MCM1443003.1 tRNA lysidine(34) synthetase TilS [Muribaculum sp.]MCM1482215.1 tRNA lysidine(34) synthetase TilS [Paludibacter sp.]